MAIHKTSQLSILLVTIVAHLILFSFLSKWINQNLLPSLSKNSIEIDLTVPPKKAEETLPPLKQLKKKQLKKLEKKKLIIPKKLKNKKLLIPKKLEKKKLIVPKKLKKKKLLISKKLKKKKLIIPKKLKNKKLLSKKKIKGKKPLILTPKNKKLLSNKIGNGTPKDKSRNKQKVVKKSLPKKITPFKLTKKNSNNTSKQKQSSSSSQEATRPFIPKHNKGRQFAGKDPILLKKQFKQKKIKKPENQIPESLRNTFRGTKPEQTNNHGIRYSMNTYQWNFKRYAKNWAVDLRKWWRPATDYLTGKKPEGGSVWIQVRLSRSGKLIGYKVFNSKVTPEMELRVIQALVSSFEQPALPGKFPKEILVVNWQFIYPPIQQFRLRK
ncbi:MAG: hypothetical protein ACI86H_002294 [bacterium]|jgi:hypothetical protein